MNKRKKKMGKRKSWVRRGLVRCLMTQLGEGECMSWDKERREKKKEGRGKTLVHKQT